MSRRRLIVAVALLGAGLGHSALAQGIDVQNRPLASIRIEGLHQYDQQLVLNQLRLHTGDPYDPQAAQQDIENLTRLGKFSTISARVEPNADGSINLIYAVTELNTLADVSVVGNRNLSDQELLEKAALHAGDPKDAFLIDRAKTEILKAYKEAGYYTASLEPDRKLLDESNILIFRIQEGPRVKVRKINFRGNQSFTDDELLSKIGTRTYIWIFRSGALSDDQLDQDVSKLREFYQQRGYLDVRVGRQIEFSNDRATATVVFLVDQGKLYTVDRIEISGNKLYSSQQIIEAMTLKSGDIFSTDRLKSTHEAILDLYGKLGFIESKVNIERTFHAQTPQVDLKVSLTESNQYLVGDLKIRGNTLTQDKVVRRQVRGLEPGRPYDTTGQKSTEQRLKESGLFSDVKLTVQGEPQDQTRDALIEVKESNTGSVTLGAAVSSDLGVFGSFDVTQRNFDIADWPASWGEFFSGRAFRGAGQYFSINIQPGDVFQNYSVTFREPYLFDTDNFLDANAGYFTRDQGPYDENRIFGRFGLGHRFGDVWSAAVRPRLEQVNLDNIDGDDAPTDVFDAQGDNLLAGLGFTVTRSTTDSAFFPTRGSRLDLGIEQVGGDWSFTKATAGAVKYFTLDEDFFQRKTVLSVRSEAGYLFQNDDEVPLFERFYAGGQRTFRGFRYRGVGPRGIATDGSLTDTAVGGEWLFLLGSEYNFPIYQDFLRGVFFVDTGTVQKDLGFDQYRVSIGTGVRVKLPFLGQAPFAFDVAMPIVKQDTDRTRWFSFDLALPF